MIEKGINVVIADVTKTTIKKQQKRIDDLKIASKRIKTLEGIVKFQNEKKAEHQQRTFTTRRAGKASSPHQSPCK
jgi:hypothetical protein